MTALDVVTNIRYWILSAVVVGLVVGPVPHVSEIITVALIAMMTFSLEGVNFKKDDLRTERRRIVLMLFCAYVVSTGTTLLFGLPFYFTDRDIWIGWVIFAVVPCAVSVVTTTFLLHGNTKLSVMGLTAVYAVAVAFTPLASAALIGDSIGPMDILRYTLLFVLVPFALSFPVKRLKVGRVPRSLVINLSFFLLVFGAFGSNRAYLFSDPVLVMSLIALIVVRLLVTLLPGDRLLRRRGVPRDDRMAYIFMCVWKNTGMGAAMAFVLFQDTPAVALPCAMAVVVDMVWLIFVLWFYDAKRYPGEIPAADAGRTA